LALLTNAVNNPAHGKVWNWHRLNQEKLMFDITVGLPHPKKGEDGFEMTKKLIKAKVTRWTDTRITAEFKAGQITSDGMLYVRNGGKKPEVYFEPTKTKRGNA
jgi:hypothetical protein